MLASELDIVLSCVYESLDRCAKCKLIRDGIEGNRRGNVYLRALLPLLDVHNEVAEEALKHVTSEEYGIHLILRGLEECAVELKKFSEQVRKCADFDICWYIICFSDFFVYYKHMCIYHSIELEYGRTGMSILKWPNVDVVMQKIQY